MNQVLQQLQRLASLLTTMHNNFNSNLQILNYWKEFLCSASEQQIRQVLRKGSDQALLVMSLTLCKQFKEFLGNDRIFELINIQMINWQQPNGKFYRGGVQIHSITLKSFGDYVSLVLKQILMNDQTEKEVLKIVTVLSQKPKYLVFVLERYIEMINVVDNSIGFVKYKALIQTFQSKIIPIIFTKLVPFFLGINDSMELKELSSLQQNLTINMQGNQNQYKMDFFQDDFFTQILFRLLRQTLDFRYNIHYTDYDNNYYGYTIKSVSYPEIVLKHMLGQDFLKALYGITSSLVKMNLNNYYQQYLDLCLYSLQKILHAKLSQLSQKERLRIIQSHFNKLSSFLQLFFQNKIAKRTSKVSILEAVLALFNIQSFDKFIKNQQNSEQFSVWLGLTYQIPFLVLRNENQPINADNQILIHSISLMYEVAIVLQKNKINNYQQNFMTIYKNYTKTLINRIVISDQNLTFALSGQKNGNTLEEVSYRCKTIFNEFKLLATYNYGDMFEYIGQIILNLQSRKGQQNVQYRWANLIFLLVHLINNNKIYECSVFGQSLIKTGHKRHVQFTNTHFINQLSQILFRVLNFIQEYSGSGMQHLYLNKAIILFLEAYLERCMEKVTVQQTSQQYEGQSYQVLDFMHKIMIKNYSSVKDDEFIATFIHIYVKFIFTNSKEFENVQYVLKSLYKLMEQFKRQTKEKFFKTRVYAKLFQFFGELVKIELPQALIKCNTHIYRVVALLLLDESLDNYKGNMKSLVKMIQQNLANEKPVKVLYDLIGILQSIQQGTVLNKFIIMIFKGINFSQLSEKLIGIIKNQPSHITNVLRLGLLLIANKQNRLQQNGIMFFTYKIINSLLPDWNNCINYMLNINDKKFKKQEVVQQICKLLDCIVKGNFINMYVLELANNVYFYSFLRAILNTAYNQIEDLNDQAVLSIKVLNSAKQLILNSQKLCFNSTNDRQLVVNLESYIAKILSYTIQHYENIVSEVFNQEILVELFETLAKYYGFILKYQERKHLAIVQSSIDYTVKNNEKLKYDFVCTITKIGISYGSKNLDINSLVSQLFVRMIRIHGFDMIQLGAFLQLTQQDDIKEMESILNDIEENKNDFYHTVGKVKDWLKNTTRYFSNSIIDEY